MIMNTERLAVLYQKFFTRVNNQFNDGFFQSHALELSVFQRMLYKSHYMLIDSLLFHSLLLYYHVSTISFSDAIDLLLNVASILF